MAGMGVPPPATIKADPDKVTEGVLRSRGVNFLNFIACSIKNQNAL